MPKGRKPFRTRTSVSDIITDMKVSLEPTASRKIPDIIEFCNSEDYLGLPYQRTPVNLTPAQALILKVFYRGSRGNEHIKLTEAELQLCEDLGLTDDVRGNVRSKYFSQAIFRELVLVWGRRCLSEDMMLIDPKDGAMHTFGELWDSGQHNIDSWTYDEQFNKMQIIKNAEIIYQGEREVFCLEAMSGFTIEATKNHPFMTQRGWIQLKDLDLEKDKIAICEEVPFFGNSQKISIDEASLLGYMTGDGNCSQTCTFFTCDNDVILKDMTSRLDAVSDNLKMFKDPWTGARSAHCQYKITSKRYVNESFYSEKAGRNRSRRKKNDLMQLLTKWDLAGKTCHYKSVPLEMFKCPKNVIAAYLRALFSCDGHVGTRNVCTIEFYSSNKQQAILIQQLLLKFGIIANLRTKKVNSYIVDEKNIKRQYHTVSYGLYFSRKLYVERFFKNIGFIGKDGAVHMALNRLLSIDSSIKTTHRDQCPFSFFKIRSINKIGKKRTFDLSVSSQKSLQSFVSNGFIAHNSGKDFCVSIIALYEALKLLECPGGDPFGYYNIADANPINILTVANSQAQSGVAYAEIRSKLLSSKYFTDKYIKDGLEEGKVYLLTPKDKEENRNFAARDMGLKTKGSIVIEVGHSNSATLLGKGVFVLILDEVASYRTTGGASSGDRIYASLTPTIATYYRKVPVLDSDGKQKVDDKGEPENDIIYDGKTISISSPRGKEGKFWELFSQADLYDTRLACRLPSWDVMPARTRQSLKREFSSMSEEEFEMEFGAEFSGIAGENFFSEEHTKSCFKGNIRFRKTGEPGQIYFLHLDPAATSHNYALALVHKQIFLNEETRKADYMIMVDLLKYWHPTTNQPVIASVVDEFVIKLKRLFRIGMVTYDAWNSIESKLRLRKAGLPNKETRFTNRHKMVIYSELLQIVNAGKLIVPNNDPAATLLMDEMVGLQKKVIPTGYRISARRNGDGIKTDDLVDALAGACYSAINMNANMLPQGKMVNMGIVPQPNERVWQGMQGPIGSGTGQQVADALANRQPWRNPVIR